MQRHELEHIIRAAAEIVQEYDIVIVGSQSILGQFPDAPGELLQSMEADVYPLHYSAKKSDLIDGTIGEGSPFEEAYGYYAQGVGPETATLPQGWQDRLVKVQSQSTDLKIGWCLEPHDLAASKLAAAREKDREFVAALLRHGLVEEAEVEKRIQAMPGTDAGRHRMAMMLGRIARENQGQQGNEAQNSTVRIHRAPSGR
ncbi:MAG: hypothetical protein FWG56_03720 [Desulfovibrionaceae bacterium]|nr:hypothetical protein [Desulfovibrionaceae bacterium]